SEHRQDTDDRSRTSSQQQHHKHKQTERRNSSRRITEADDQEGAPACVSDEDAQSDGNCRSNAHRRDGIEQVLEQQVPDPVGTLPVSGIGKIAEKVHAGRLFSHGNVPAWMSKIRPSKISDSASIKINAMMIGV